MWGPSDEGWRSKVGENIIIEKMWIEEPGQARPDHVNFGEGC